MARPPRRVVCGVTRCALIIRVEQPRSTTGHLNWSAKTPAPKASHRRLRNSASPSGAVDHTIARKTSALS
jgi:hypothetical protein